MATINPLAALRPKPELAGKICELPYDVMSSEEAREIAAGKPLSFLHVSKPEIDLPPDTDLYSEPVYAKGKENFQRLIAQGALHQDPQPRFYLYRQIMGQHSQVGLVAAASCEDYLRGVIKKHELTRPDKEDDRVRHIEALNSQTGPVFLVYKATTVLNDIMRKRCAGPPEIDFTSPDSVRHSAWVIADANEIRSVEDEFARVPALYIADGHHRCAAAARVYQARHGAGESATFLSVIFPHDQVQILPYNRVLKRVGGTEPEALLNRLHRTFDVDSPPGFAGVPARRHELGLYLAGQWHRLTFHPELTRADDPIQRLDVSLLQELVLRPVFGIDDPRTSKHIQFVGGIRGTTELQRLVDSREYTCAFSLFPTSIDELMAVADAGQIMPPKSTWFEPKLRDAMFCHML